MSTVDPNIAPGIYQGIPADAYHTGPGVSKSGLWQIVNRSPAHYRYGKRKESKAFDLGTACHLAILEPNEFEKTVVRGPDDRRGNAWKHAVEACSLDNRLLLTSGDHDKALAIRDAVHANSRINAILTGGKPLIEASGYWIDEATGQLCRCRPDLYREDLALIVDVKTTVNASPDAFAKAVDSYGYHAQEAFYSDGWTHLGKPLDGWLFLAWEKEEPFACALHECSPSMVEEGRAMMRAALNTYAECKAADNWPAYGDDVHQLSFKRWSYRFTDAPEGEEE